MRRSKIGKIYRKFEKKSFNIRAYRSCVGDLLGSDRVKEMSNFIQHRDITCLDHCISVSYYSFLLCRLLRMDCRSAARGALLHDLFLYDWHDTTPAEGLHAFVHPTIALRNADIFDLNETEKDIIKKHMWPLTVIPPKHFESFIVSCVDKYCAFAETVLKMKSVQIQPA